MTSTSLVEVEVGGVRYPVKTEPRCHACQHPRRAVAERMVAEGVPYGSIVERLEMLPEVSARNLRDHVLADHLPLTAPSVRMVAAEKAGQVEEYLVPATAAVAQNLGLAHAVVERVRARLASGDAEPTIRDGLAAARLIAEAEPRNDDEATYQQAFLALIEAARALIPRERWQEFHRDVRRSLSTADPVAMVEP